MWSIYNSAGDKSKCEEEVKVGEPENLPGRPLLRSGLSWMTSTLYTADSDCDPTNIHMLPFIYWKKLTDFHKFSLLARFFRIKPCKGWLYHGNSETSITFFSFSSFFRSTNGARTYSVTGKFSEKTY